MLVIFYVKLIWATYVAKYLLQKDFAMSKVTGDKFSYSAFLLTSLDSYMDAIERKYFCQ